MALDEGHGHGGGGDGPTGNFMIEVTTCNGLIKTDNAHEAIHEFMEMMFTGDEKIAKEGFAGLCALGTVVDVLLFKMNKHVATKFDTGDEECPIIILVKQGE